MVDGRAQSANVARLYFPPAGAAVLAGVIARPFSSSSSWTTTPVEATGLFDVSEDGGAGSGAGVGAGSGSASGNGGGSASGDASSLPSSALAADDPAYGCRYFRAVFALNSGVCTPREDRVDDDGCRGSAI